jgi:thermitase
MPKQLRIKKVTILNSSIVILCVLSGQLSAQQYIIKPKNPLKNYDLSGLTVFTNTSFKVADTLEDMNLVKVETGSYDSAVDSVGLLTHYFDALYVVENIKLYAFTNPNDPKYREQWALDKVKASSAWDLSLGSENVVVAVIDTGIDLSHEDLNTNLWANPNEIADNGIDDDKNGFVDDINGWDFNGNDKDPVDETSAQNPGHGTHCSGIIGAACGNDVGICGISPAISIMAVRFLGSDGSGDLFAAVKAIDYAVNNGAQIISASFGATVPTPQAQPMIDAIIRAETKGVIFIAAAGNEGNSNDTTNVYPANTNSANVISVAASDQDDQKPSWSNYGRKVAIAAPGENILSTIPGGYTNLSGTSMATPLVAGIVALMKSLDMSLRGIEVRSILQSSGQEVNIETESKRRVDAHAALEAVLDKKLTLVPATHTIEPKGQFSAWGGTPPYRFQSLHESVATIDAQGNFVAQGTGDVTIEVSDAQNNTARSVSIRVGEPPKEDSGCPLKEEVLCIILCAIDPKLPWCKNMPTLPIPLLIPNLAK